MGRLVHDPMIKPNARSAFFTVACNRSFLGRDGSPHQETAFLPCRCYGLLTTTLDNCVKGDLVMVTGRLRTEDWNDRGAKRSPLVLVCDSIRILPGNRQVNDPLPGTMSETWSSGISPKHA